MRIDRFLSQQGLGTRKGVKKIINACRVKVNNRIVTDNTIYIYGDDIITVDDKQIENLPYITILLNKPEGYISSLIDETYPSILNLIPERYKKRVKIVGRLDADTTGLILLTDNGVLNARLTNPNYHIQKRYKVIVNHILKPSLVDIFSSPIDIGRNEVVQPDKLEIVDEYTAYLTIHDGKYHEVKRLFGKFSYDVVSLERVNLATLSLGDLKRGEWRLIQGEEYLSLLSSVHLKKEDTL